MALKNKIMKSAAVALFWLLVWQVLHMAVRHSVLIPAPLAVAKRLLALVLTVPFWLSVLSSLLRIALGFLLALAAGCLFGAASVRSQLFRTLFSPLISVIRATPVASFIILLYVFLTKNRIPSVTAFLIVLPVVWANVQEGLQHLDSQLLEMAAVFRMPKKTVFRFICLPGVMPFFLSAAKTGLGLAWKAGIAAEVLVSPALGIGSRLYDAKVCVESVDLFAWTVVIIVISMLLEKVFLRLLGRIYHAD